jgi:hypothetical protein
MKALRRGRGNVLLYTVAIAVMICHGVPVAIAQSSPKVHDLKAAPNTVHRSLFDVSPKPVLTIDSGDIVRLETRHRQPELLRESWGAQREDFR